MVRRNKYTVGSQWTTKKYGNLEVIEELCTKKVKVKFLLTGTETICSKKSILKQSVKDVYSYTSYYNVACQGNTTTTVSGKNKNSFNVWSSMIKRCYKDGGDTSYKETSVCKDWLCYENYEKWFDKHKVEGYEVDKDFTIIGNKVYSPQTCSFIPNEINALFSPDPNKSSGLPEGVFDSHAKAKRYRARGYHNKVHTCLKYHETKEQAFLAYKIYKESLVKVLATEYYSAGKINYTVYNNLLQYEVTIKG